MSNAILFEKFSKLPDYLKVEVLDFVEFLEYKKASEIQKKQSDEKKGPVFGYAKGKYVMSADFDEPLDEFKDYM
ncbi:type II toxin-antitoxin system VapB family antitoxin [Emticicia sp. SJ17W-69]|uniref:type II toxin-antitoxin system VapB family antitoxin n=1 Tax=Emticicia sp. SJ17W-69 TaxID=3421657 RepID=UPI003EB9B3E7